MRITAYAVVLTLVVLTAAAAAGPDRYPLDGYQYTGIRRLRAYDLIHHGGMPGNLRLQPGALLPSTAIRLRMASLNESYDIGAGTPLDSELQAGLERIIPRHPSYRVAILDISDPTRPRFAAIRPDEGYIPGSVGKILVLTALFNELKKLYPDDLEARADLLRNTRVVADRFVIPNSHEVPVVDDAMNSVVHRAIRVGDAFTLWEWVDHMVSPSSNAAGSIVWKQALLMNAFGHGYPPSAEEEAEFFRTTPAAELSARAIQLIEEPLLAIGIDTTGLRQRTFFTATASRIIPGKSSVATPRQLVRWLLKLEQGQVVDRWSSLEMKKLLYFTRRRYRYAASPALANAAVFFKSGSLYRCVPEEGYNCGKYRGNAENLMHSVAIVESPASGERQRVYLISMMSNVLKVNSAAEHAEIATKIERLVTTLNP